MVKKIKVKIRIPKEIIDPAIEQVKEFIGTGHIGEVYLAGDWKGNDWGHSQKRAGCIDPASTTKMRLEKGFYVAEIEVSARLHGFKPVVIKGDTDEDGMASATWIACPKKGVREYICETWDAFGNWLVKIRETE